MKHEIAQLKWIDKVFGTNIKWNKWMDLCTRYPALPDSTPLWRQTKIKSPFGAKWKKKNYALTLAASRCVWSASSFFL